MANALASRALSMGNTARFTRFPYNFISNFSFSTSPTTVVSSDESQPTSNPRRKKKKKNLFEVAQFLPNWGIGYHIAKSHWTNVSYEITKINLYKDGRHGKAWGIAYKDGMAADAAKKISGVHKRCWRYIPNSIKAEELTSAAPIVQTV